jgi:hypothetical protein
MPRHIEKNANRTTFHKLRRELFKEATELSTLTGARIAVVLELANGEIHTFGTPSAKFVVEKFLSGNPRMDFHGEKNASIVQLQRELAEVEKDPVEMKESTKALKNVGSEFPQDHMAPQMPQPHTYLGQPGSSAGGNSVGANGVYGLGASSQGY